MNGGSPQLKTLSELLVLEPLTASTESRGRKLVISSSAAILISVYGLQVKSTAWLELDVPTGAPNVLTGALSVVVIYYLLAFGFFAYADLMRWLGSSRILNLNSFWNLALHMRSDVQRLSQGVCRPQMGPQMLRDLEASARKTAAFCETLEAKVQEIDSLASRLTHTQIIRLVTFDVGLPIVLGLFATAKLWPAFWPFVRTLFQ